MKPFWIDRFCALLVAVVLPILVVLVIFANRGIVTNLFAVAGCAPTGERVQDADPPPDEVEREADPQPDWLPVHVAGRLGFIDDDGKLLFMTEFSEYEDIAPGIPDWTEGFLWVGSNFVDRAGRTLSKVPLDRFDFMIAPWIENGMAYVSFLDKGKWRYGLIDTTGRIVFGSDYFFRPDRINENRCPVPMGDKFGYIETNGTVVIPGRYECAWRFQRGLAWVQSNGKWGAIDRQGEFVISPVYDAVEYSGFQEGIAWVKQRKRWGVLDTSGRWRVKPRFEAVAWVHDGLACVTHRGRSGVVDADGNFIVPPKYDEVDYVFGSAELWKVRRNGKSGLAMSNGIEVFPEEYDGFRSDGKDTKGHAVIPPLYDDADNKFKHGLASVALGERRENLVYGVVDTNGNVVVPLEYTRAEVVKPGIVKLHIGRRYGYLKIPDTWIWQPTE